MADECRYYYYDSGYSCMLKREKEGSSSIDSDTVHRYCWGYHYEECPRYKAGTSSGGCFLTSACTEAKGLADDCYELTMLRAFRDEYLVKQKSGKAEIAHYYITAPKIVETINADGNRAGNMGKSVSRAGFALHQIDRVIRPGRCTRSLPPLCTGSGRTISSRLKNTYKKGKSI